MMTYDAGSRRLRVRMTCRHHAMVVCFLIGCARIVHGYDSPQHKDLTKAAFRAIEVTNNQAAIAWLSRTAPPDSDQTAKQWFQLIYGIYDEGESPDSKPVVFNHGKEVADAVNHFVAEGLYPFSVDLNLRPEVIPFIVRFYVPYMLHSESSEYGVSQFKLGVQHTYVFDPDFSEVMDIAQNVVFGFKTISEQSMLPVTTASCHRRS